MLAKGNAAMSQQNKFVIALYNVENLFIHLDRLQGEFPPNISEKQWQKLSSPKTPNKPLSKTWAVADTIREMDADVVLLNEVGGMDSLSNFNYHFLGNEYQPHLIPGNSKRGIDVGFLIKRSCPWVSEVDTNRDSVIDLTYPHEHRLKKTPHHKLSRDLAELYLSDPKSGELKMILLLTHLKSKLDSEKIDAFGSLRREAETKKIIQLYNQLRKKHDAPILLCGDFNGHAGPTETEHEFLSIYEDSDLIEVLDYLGIERERRLTHLQFLRSGQIRHLQIDYVFSDPKTAKSLIPGQCGVYRYKNKGAEWPLPINLAQRYQMPSDHFPLVVTIDTDKLFTSS